MSGTASPSGTGMSRRNRRTLILLALVTVAPVIASYAAYYWFPRDKQANYGELLPTRPAPELAGVTPGGAPFRLSELRGRWVLAVAAPGACDARARRRSTRRGRRARSRAAKWSASRACWLVTGDGAPPAALAAEHPDLVTARVPAGALGAWPAGDERIYLVDPLGNLVLAFPRDPDIKAMAKDLDAPAQGIADWLGAAGSIGVKSRSFRPSCRTSAAHDRPSPRRKPLPAIPGADQAARRVAHRVLRGDRHVPRGAGTAARGRRVHGDVGIALVAGAAAAVNCLVEQKIDAVMLRTRARPLPRGDLTSLQTLLFAGVVGGIGLWILYRYVNPLTMWLTLATFVGYAVIYTVLLKPATPQNIVIGGASGAMPPVLGWAAVANDVAPEALLLFLIIFVWTPPHFWALALYRTKDYARAGLPMLPVTHGSALHAAHDRALHDRAGRRDAAAVLDPDERRPLPRRRARRSAPCSWATPSGSIADYSDELARATFRYSIVYLAALFSALLVDHYWQ